MTPRVLVTGSAGLIGSVLCDVLAAAGMQVRGLDLRAVDDARGDVCDAGRVAAALAGCDGVVHLAAVSRVLWAESDPWRCHDTNVGGLATVLEAALRQPRPPWLVFASSREVYGEAAEMPVSEAAPLHPVNAYGRSKVAGEALVAAAAARGLRTAVVRLSNVYGRTSDHADRVVPAFARAAALGAPLHVAGRGLFFDFTHVDDVCPGLLALVRQRAVSDAPLPPLHFVSGRAHTLGELAGLAVSLSGRGSCIVDAPPRRCDVGGFRGCGERARLLLGWTPRIALADGLQSLIAAFRDMSPVPTDVAAGRGGFAETANRSQPRRGICLN